MVYLYNLRVTHVGQINVKQNQFFSFPFLLWLKNKCFGNSKTLLYSSKETRAVLGFRGFWFSRCVEQVVVWNRVIRFGLVSVCVLTFTDWFRVCPEPWCSDRELIVMCLLDYLGKGAKSNQGFSCKWVPGSVL